MLSTPDHVWLKTVFPLFVQNAPDIIEICKMYATNPFTENETLFGRNNPRAKFWAELGRLTGECMQNQWKRGDITLEQADLCSQHVSEHLLSEYNRVVALNQHIERTKPL